jgi:hypothetical protein
MRSGTLDRAVNFKASPQSSSAQAWKKARAASSGVMDSYTTLLASGSGSTNQMTSSGRVSVNCSESITGLYRMSVIFSTSTSPLPVWM